MQSILTDLRPSRAEGHHLAVILLCVVAGILLPILPLIIGRESRGILMVANEKVVKAIVMVFTICAMFIALAYFPL
jgi:hypothetical protein